MTDDEYKILKSITKTTRQKPKNKMEFLRLIFLLAERFFGKM